MNFKSIFLFIMFIVLFSIVGLSQKDKNLISSKYTLVIHGGAGTIVKSKMTPELEKEYLAALNEALSIGEQILDSGGLAIDAVESVVKFMENSPLFNAGKGSVYSNNGKNEMDAAIMDGRDLSCGALTGITCLKNPIEGARLVKDNSEHVFLSGEEGQEYCIKLGAQCMDSSYFYTDFRWNQLMKAIEKDSVSLDHSQNHSIYNEIEKIDKFGTVGAVAIDSYGNLAAATSTGGLTNKKHGRIGDTPVIGAGTYADNKTCAISCTGKGEYFIRGTIARDISARMEFGHNSLKHASNRTMKKLQSLGGSGGFIGVDKKGNIVMMFNTRGMYRGYVQENKVPIVEIYE